ncbi:uncharacterized protein LOC141680084 [Apium graveolens]|uniref:uncharacterized protein LOC141680084 n=1 Tax=Apium graveolens TaxID=4045 RepID=UPI003D7A4191
MKSPASVKQVQTTGRIATFNRFVSKSSDKWKEFFKAIKSVGNDFFWTLKCEEAFRRIKEQLGNPPMLEKPIEGEILILYLVVSEYSINVALVREEGSHQSPIYYVTVKGLTFVDFLLEFDSEIDERAIVLAKPSSRGDTSEIVKEEFPHPWWILHVYSVVHIDGSGAEIVLITSKGHHLMSAIHFKLCVTNNDVEYEALINTPKMALEVGVVNLIARSNLELVVNQVNGGFQARGPRTELYMKCAQHLLQRFGEVRLEYDALKLGVRNEDS